MHSSARSLRLATSRLPRSARPSNLLRARHKSWAAIRSKAQRSACGAVMSDGKANAAEDVPHAEAAWQWFNGLGAPKHWVAPMVDQSELAFRVLCMRHGADAAYSPMLHARLFSEGAAYRAEHFTTAPGDRPLLAQFCANDPATLLAAARHVEARVDGVDINLGCPQRIAKKGKYGAYLMDDVALVERLVSRLAGGLSVPVTVKIRRFPDAAKTVAYAAALERAGASLVAVHGRTREQKRAGEVLADWEAIRAVKAALRVPVLANGNIQTLRDVARCMEATGADGVMSAESLLSDPALYSPRRLEAGGAQGPLDGARLLLEYLELAEQYPTPFRMVKGHAFKMLGPWLAEHVDLREKLNRGPDMSVEALRGLTLEIIARVEACGRDHPIPHISAKKLEKLEAEAAKQRAIAEQKQEEEAMELLGQGLLDRAQAEAGGAAAPTPAAAEPAAGQAVEAAAPAPEGQAEPAGQLVAAG